ncbi:MAG: hypothetical protein GX582_02425 [Acholeplasmataceae bacterium]|nr:hypothetical protein [Acholeplasmataceae bacterium]
MKSVLKMGVWFMLRPRHRMMKNQKNSTRDLKKGLTTLSESSHLVENHKLVYITNIKTMLGSNTERDAFPSGVSVSFDAIGELNKKLVCNYAPESFDYNSFSIQFLRYVGENGSETEWIIGKIRDDFSERGDMIRTLSPKFVFETWVRYLDSNASNKDTSIKCDRSRIVWGMILHKINHIENSLYQESVEDYSIVSDSYSDLVDSISGRFEIMSRIIGDYRIEKNKLKINNDFFDKFAADYWQEYRDILEALDVDEVVKEKILKILIQTVLMKRNVIRSVCNEMKI